MKQVHSLQIGCWKTEGFPEEQAVSITIEIDGKEGKISFHAALFTCHSAG